MPAAEGVTLCLPYKDGWLPLEAEVAATAGARAEGLKGREELGRREGMLFVYPEPQGQENRFWMHRTPLPLTVAFLGGDGTLLALQGMSPCMSEDGAECAYYEAGVRHSAALEVNQGLFRALGVSEGQRITLDASRQADCSSMKPFSVDLVPAPLLSFLFPDLVQFPVNH